SDRDDVIVLPPCWRCERKPNPRGVEVVNWHGWQPNRRYDATEAAPRRLPAVKRYTSRLRWRRRRGAKKPIDASLAISSASFRHLRATSSSISRASGFLTKAACCSHLLAIW